MSLDCFDGDGGFYTKTYYIPFRPEYLLIDGPDSRDFVNAAQPTGRDVKAFRFHLSPEAVDLLIEQDPTVDHTMGFHALSINFHACTDGVATIEVTRLVHTKAPQSV